MEIQTPHSSSLQIVSDTLLNALLATIMGYAGYIAIENSEALPLGSGFNQGMGGLVIGIAFFLAGWNLINGIGKVTLRVPSFWKYGLSALFLIVYICTVYGAFSVLRIFLVGVPG